MFPIAWWSVPIDTPGGRAVALAFTTHERLPPKRRYGRDAAEIVPSSRWRPSNANLELADQNALRRVATLVARGASPSEVFAAVSNELARVLHVVNAACCASSPTALGGVVAVQYEAGITEMPVERIPLAGDDVGARGHTGRRPGLTTTHAPPARKPNAYVNRASTDRRVPVIVDAALGAAIVGSRRPSPCRRTSRRASATSDLVATAITNAATRSELQASQDELRMLAYIRPRAFASTISRRSCSGRTTAAGRGRTLRGVLPATRR
jgi:hypothetical protein